MKLSYIVINIMRWFSCYDTTRTIRKRHNAVFAVNAQAHGVWIFIWLSCPRRNSTSPFTSGCSGFSVVLALVSSVASSFHKSNELICIAYTRFDCNTSAMYNTFLVDKACMRNLLGHAFYPILPLASCIHSRTW